MSEVATLNEAGRLIAEVEASPRRFRRYSDYRNCGVRWLGRIPTHWKVRRLKFVADIQNSNVDKKTEAEEAPVRLCNYVDVYHRDYITSDIDFMRASASKDEIRKFALRRGDVLITKDSEAWNDIAVPAYVDEEFDGVLCGYHLAQVRPRPDLADGEFLHRAFVAHPVRDQFRVRANGITRYGLSADAIASAVFPIPPLDEQKTIAAFLRRETAKIDALVAKKRRLIELLQEKRTALISRAVTKGLNPDAPLKPSGIDWLGDVPAHWDVKRLKFLFTNLNSRRVPLSSEERATMAKIYPYYGASGIIDQVDDFLFDEPLILVAEDGANLLSRSTPLAFMATGQYWVNNHAHILRPISGPIVFWEAALQLAPLEPLVSGSAQPKLTKDNLGMVRLPVPPLGEQEQLASNIERINGRFGAISKTIQNAVDRLVEYRSALISAAVTGQIDVRGEVAA